jgi:hypothetical protein
MRRAHARRQHSLAKLIKSGEESNAVIMKRPSELVQERGSVNARVDSPLFQTAINLNKQLAGTARGFFEGFLAKVKRHSHVGRIIPLH